MMYYCLHLVLYNYCKRTETYVVADCGLLSCRAAPPLLRDVNFQISKETAIIIYFLCVPCRSSANTLQSFEKESKIQH